MKKYPIPPYPNGWFRVAFSDEVPPGSVKAVKYFGREHAQAVWDAGLAAIAQIDDAGRAALQGDVVIGLRSFVKDGTLDIDANVVLTTAST